MHALKTPHLTISDPENSLQKAFHLAFLKIKSGLQSSICLISADESKFFGEVNASAQMYFLVNSEVSLGLKSEFVEEVFYDSTP